MEAIEVNRSAREYEVTRVPKGRFDFSFWREDLTAGITLTPLIIAFAIGIAGMSLFPQQSGLVSAVVAIVAAAFLGGSYVVLCGSAAALAPILANLVLTLGQGDMMLGYERTLAVIVVTGPIMIYMVRKKLVQKLTTFCPHAVMLGVMAAIAFMLIAGRIETFAGVALEAKGHGLLKLKEFFWDGKYLGVVWPVFFTTAATFGALIIVSALRSRVRVLRSFPSQLWAILLLLLLGLMAPLSPQYRISIPEEFWSFHRWPDFDVVAMWNDGVFFAFVKGVVTLSFVDPLETVAAVLMFDKMDKYWRKSDLNRTVISMAVANSVGGMGGGTSSIPGVAQSRISVEVGTVTPLATLYAAGFVVLIVWLARDVLNLFSIAGLSAVIVFTVYPLCAPAMWRKVLKTGVDQLAVVAITFVVSILVWDILAGIFAGVILKLVIVLGVAYRVIKYRTGSQSFLDLMKLLWKRFRHPKVKVVVATDGSCDVYFSGLWGFWSPVEKVLESIPTNVQTVNFHLTRRLLVIDQPTIEKLLHFLYGKSGKLVEAKSLQSFWDCRDQAATRFAPYRK